MGTLYFRDGGRVVGAGGFDGGSAVGMALRLTVGRRSIRGLRSMPPAPRLQDSGDTEPVSETPESYFPSLSLSSSCRGVAENVSVTA
jgi:hypothetical protein